MASSGRHTHGLNQEQDAIDISQYVSLVKERKRLFFVIAFLVMTAAVVACYVLPKKYRASSIVFIEENVVNNLVKGIAVTPSMDNKIKAIKVTMLSRTMILKVIQELDLDVPLASNVELDALIKELQSEIGVRMDEKKGVFIISYTSENPALSANVVNTITRIYIEENTSSKRQESYEATTFLAEQIETFKKRIDSAEAEIDKFRTESGKFLSKDEVSMRAEIARNEAVLVDLQTRINSLNASRRVLLSNTPLRRQLQQQEDLLAAQLSRYTEKHPQVVRAKSLIASTKRQMKSQGAEERRAVYRTQDYQQIAVELESLDKKKRSLEKIVAESREILLMIPAKRTELTELERKKANEVLIYEKLVSRYGQSEVSKEMELQNKSVSFKVLDPAVRPTSAVSPNRPMIIAAGIAAGIGAALGLIILLDLLNPSIKSEDTIKRLGIPVFAVVPVFDNPVADARRRRGNLFVYFCAACYFGVILAFLSVEYLQLPLVDNAIVKLRGYI